MHTIQETFKILSDDVYMLTNVTVLLAVLFVTLVMQRLG